MRSPVRFQRPHLHLTKPLAPKLRLTSERLLGHETIGPDRPGVDLVIHQVGQLEHVQGSDRNLRVEPVAGASVTKATFPHWREPR